MTKKTLKEHRLLKHLSQQELADRAGVSLRTVQRIEKNASSGSLYAMRMLREVLQIENESLLLVIENEEVHNSQARHKVESEEILHEKVFNRPPIPIWLKYINFSTLLFLIIPFSNLITAPVLYWSFKRKLSTPIERAYALKVISFEVIWSALTLLMLVFTPLIDYLFFHVVEVLEIPLFFWAYLILVFLHLIATLTAAARLNKGVDPVPYLPNIF